MRLHSFQHTTGPFDVRFPRGAVKEPAVAGDDDRVAGEALVRGLGLLNPLKQVAESTVGPVQDLRADILTRPEGSAWLRARSGWAYLAWPEAA